MLAVSKKTTAKKEKNMKDKTKALVTILLSSIVILTGFIILYSAAPVEAAFSLQDIDNTIANALDWCDRYLYFEVNSTHAMCLTAPFLQFRIKHPDGHFTISGKTTDVDGKPVNWPSGTTRDNMRGGCESSETTNRNSITGESFSTISLLWKFDCDGSGNIDDVVLYMELVGWNATHEKLFLKIDSCGNGFSNANYILQIFDKNDATQQGIITNVTTNIITGNSYTLGPQPGWRTRQCFMRPTLKGLADLYYQLNRTINPSTGYTYARDRGINYSARAEKLLRSFYGSGYIIDRFDAMYNVTLKERPFPNINQGYGPTPDLIVEYANGAFPDSTGPYLNASDKDQHWYAYSNASRLGTTQWVYRHNTISRAGMPDDIEFYKSPFLCDNNNFIYSYRSRTAFAMARNQYLANGLEYDLAHYDILGKTKIPWVDILQGFGSDVKMLRCISDLYKYNTSTPYSMTELKRMVKAVKWDGYGVAIDYMFEGLPLGWPYPAYATHITAPYLLANILTYNATGDSSFLARADEVASVLMRIQVKQGTTLYTRNNAQQVYMPDWKGGFLSGYCIAYSFGQSDILWESWTEGIYSILHMMYAGTGGQLGFVYDSFPYTAIPSPESTLPAIWALIEYRKLGRTPPSPTPPAFNLPFQDCYMEMDHGGNSGGDGTYQLVSDRFNETYIGGTTGNLRAYTGNVDRIRLGADCGLLGGDGWATAKWKWNFTLNYEVHDLRGKMFFTIPNYVAIKGPLGGNSLAINITIKHRDNQTIIKDEKVTPFDGLTNQGLNGLMIALDNLTVITSLGRGNYSIELLMRMHAGGVGTNCFYAGYHYGGMIMAVPGMPIGLEYFGLDWTPIYTGMKTSTDGAFDYIPNRPDKNMTALKVELWYTNASANGDQCGGTSPYGYLFTQWPDQTVNILDLNIVSRYWGIRDNETGWLAETYMADIGEDHVINIVDQTPISQNWGKTGTNWYSTLMTNIGIKFNGEASYTTVDSYGYRDIPNGKTSFAVAKYNGTAWNPVGAIVTFYGKEIGP